MPEGRASADVRSDFSAIVSARIVSGGIPAEMAAPGTSAAKLVTLPMEDNSIASAATAGGSPGWKTASEGAGLDPGRGQNFQVSQARSAKSSKGASQINARCSVRQASSRLPTAESASANPNVSPNAFLAPRDCNQQYSSP